MILNNVENIYIGGTKVEKVMFNLMPIWPRLQDTVAESMRRLNFFWSTKCRWRQFIFRR